MSTTASTRVTRSSGSGRAAAPGTAGDLGFCRVTVAAPDSRTDLALPDDVPVADLRPDILRLARQNPEPGAPVGYHLVRRDGTVLDGSRTLAALGVLDGELLLLRPFSESLPPAVHDDVSEAVAAAVSRSHRMWNNDLTRVFGLAGGAALPALLAFVVWHADPRHDMHGLPGVLAAVTGLVLLVLAAVRARVHDDSASALALGLGALPAAAVAGSGLLPFAEGQGTSKLQFLLACAAVLIASLVLALCSRGGDAPFVACASAAAVALAAVFFAVLAHRTPTETAALCAPVAVTALAFLPGMSLRLARLPLGHETRPAVHGGEPEPRDPVDLAHVEARARRGHELLAGLVGGSALLATGSCAALGFSGDLWAQLLALATGTALLMRAQVFRRTPQVAACLTAGLACLVLLGLGLALNPPPSMLRAALAGDRTDLDVRTVWLVTAIAAAAALVTAIGLLVPRGGTPFWGRSLEIAEGFVLLTLIPLALAVLDVYASARAMTS